MVVRLMLVDDDPVALEAVGHMLRHSLSGVSIEICGNPVSALLRLKAESFAVVLSDYHMPGMNGLRFLQAARECESKASFIMVTGDPTDDILTDGLRLGLVALLKKPLTRTALVPLIQHAIEYSYLQHEVVELRRTLSESGIGLGKWIDRISRYPSEEPQVLLPF